jgi:hypothetical protein
VPDAASSLDATIALMDASAVPPSSSYPLGPYGTNVGDVVPYLYWQGYVNEDAVGLSSSEPFVDYSTDDMRRSGRAFGLVHASEFY